MSDVHAHRSYLYKLFFALFQFKTHIDIHRIGELAY